MDNRASGKYSLGLGPINYLTRFSLILQPTLNGFWPPSPTRMDRTREHSWGTKQRRAAKLRRQMGA